MSSKAAMRSLQAATVQNTWMHMCATMQQSKGVLKQPSTIHGYDTGQMHTHPLFCCCGYHLVNFHCFSEIYVSQPARGKCFILSRAKSWKELARELEVHTILWSTSWGTLICCRTVFLACADWAACPALQLWFLMPSAHSILFDHELIALVGIRLVSVARLSRQS